MSERLDSNVVKGQIFRIPGPDGKTYISTDDALTLENAANESGPQTSEIEKRHLTSLNDNLRKFFQK